MILVPILPYTLVLAQGLGFLLSFSIPLSLIWHAGQLARSEQCPIMSNQSFQSLACKVSEQWAEGTTWFLVGDIIPIEYKHI